LSEYARNLRKECADLAAGQAVLTAEDKSAKEIAGLRAAVLKVSTARTFPVTRLIRSYCANVSWMPHPNSRPMPKE
jgi:hypothetical protein